MSESKEFNTILMPSIGLNIGNIDPKFRTLYDQILLRQDNGALIIALVPNSEFFRKYKIEDSEILNQLKIPNYPQILSCHLEKEN
ncbi:unknown similar to AMEV086 [Mythimna separata entomopoxvirus 'L']|uniref:Uncharacterized protein n=1 Tax=Mythimna separata entomopoxvirus 'L' TaxID=1293572 RepID=A0A916P1F8_9POXV|nr:unknown similar to AMEV086 [Mythimna separata entomopoxvirus 'L']CCU56307.1 unknown similar to AMEV086 [Mythimna separata entomopoxvirus 'L']